MAITTLGRQIIKSKLPEKYKSFAETPLTKARQQTLMTALAKEDPDRYIDILQDMNLIAQSVVSTYGKDTTITLDDIDAGAQVRNTRAKLQSIIKTVVNRDDLTPQQKQQKIIQLGYKYMPKVKDLGLQDARRRKTGIANQIASGSRGNPVQLMQLIAGDMMMKDAANRDIPYVALMPYSDGDSPMSYWASAMSGRKSTYDTQAATGLAGYLSKQATNIVQSTPIAMRDCGTTDTGIPVKASDSQNIGALLLRPWRGYPAGTVVTQQMVDQADDDQEFIVRSPNTCKAHGGVCALCSGIQQNGKLPPIGTYVALNATKSFIQPLTQSGVSCLRPDTVVRMASGQTKKLKQVQVGDYILGTSVSRQLAPTKVTNIFDNGVQPVYRITFQSSNRKAVIECTLQHKIVGQDLSGNLKKLPIGKARKAAFLDTQLLDKAREQFLGNLPTMDIQVDNDDHLFVLQNGLLISNSKHGSGMGGKNQDPEGIDQPTGLDSVKRMLLAPSNFPGGAVLAPVDGRVSGIRQAPQGGSYITIGQSTVYAPSVRTLKVKQGDYMQAGDTLTNGVPNPMQVVKYKGIGQGRHYYMQKLNQILPKSGAGTARRNIEQFSRSMINKVRITSDDGYAGYYPGDIADYDQLIKTWTPRENSKQLKIKQAQGKYLELPLLYYSVGTRITPKVIANLQKYGYSQVTANDDPPPFQPQFISSKAFSMHNKSWIARFNGERLRDAAFAATRKGITDTYDSPSFLDKLIVAPYNPANTKPAGI